MAADRPTGARPDALLAGLVIIAGLWLIGALFAWHSRTVEQERAQSGIERLAGSMANGLHTMLLGTDRAMAWVMDAFAVEAQRFRFERFRATDLLHTATVGLPFVERIMVIDRDGTLLHDAAAPDLRGIRPLPPELLARLDAAWRAPAAGPPALVVATVPGDDGSGAGSLYLGRMMTDSIGAPLGHLVVIIRRDAVVAFFRAAGLADAGHAALYGPSGRLVLSGAPTPALPAALPPGMASLLEGTAGGRPAVDRDPPAGDGPSMLLTRVAVPGYPLVVAIAVPWNEAMGRWQEDTRAYALLALILTGLVLAATLALHRSMRAGQRQANLLAARERELASLFANAGAGITLMDHTGVIRSANQAYARLIGLAPEAVPGHSIYALSPAEDHTIMRDGMRRALRGDGGVTYEKRYRRPDGSDVWVAVSLSAQPAPESATAVPPDLVAVVVDITDRHLVEERLAAQAQELARSNVELEQFAYVASHDLQEPLRTIVSYLQLLERRNGDRLDAEGREFLGFAVGGARHMSRLIQDLLEYARVGRAGAVDTPVNLRALALQAAEMVWRPAPPTDPAQALKLEWDPEIIIFPDDLVVPGNAQELARLFQNLLGNAIKYRAPNRPLRVEVLATLRPGEVEVTVRDNGIGFAPQFADRVFKLFQRLHTSGYDGTGIGLAVCRKVVQHHGGHIWCDAREGQGAAFHFTLPRCRQRPANSPCSTRLPGTTDNRAAVPPGSSSTARTG